jgi:hypothetical protein
MQQIKKKKQLWSVIFSKMVYLTQSEFETARQAIGFGSFSADTIKDPSNPKSLMHAALLENESTVIVIIRGTKGYADIKLDTDTDLVHHVHKGFHDRTASIWAALQRIPTFKRHITKSDAKSPEERKSKGKKCFVFGHSLGGAVAVVLAVRYLAEKTDLAVQRVVSCGKPKVWPVLRFF